MDDRILATRSPRRVLVFGFLVTLDKSLCVIERFGLISFVRQLGCRRSHIQLASHHVGDQAGSVFAEEGDFAA